VILLWSTVISSVGGFILGFLVFLKAEKKAGNISFSLVSILISLVVAANYFSLTNKDSTDSTLFWIRAVMFLVPFLMVAIFYFCSSYLNDDFKLRTKRVVFLILIATLLSIINITSLTYSSVQISSDGTIIPTTGFGLILNAFFILPLFGLAVIVMIRNIKKSSDPHKKNMIKFAFYLILVSFGTQIITSFVIVAAFNYTALVPLGSFLIFLFVILMTVSIFYYKAFKISLVGAVVFAVILSVLTFAEIFTAKGIQEISYKIIVFLSVALIGYQFIRSVYKEIERRKIMEDLANKLDVANKNLLSLQQINNKIVSTLDLKKVSQEIVDSTRNELKYKGAFLVLVDKKKNLIRPLAITGGAISSIIKKYLHKPFNKYTLPFHNNNDSIIQHSIKQCEIKTTDSLQKVLKGALGLRTTILIQEAINIKSFIVAPIVSRGEVIGVIIFASGKNEDEIKESERKMISSVADQAAIAIENAKLYEELEKANEKLKELDKLKNEFLSIASHQIRTPLSIVKGYISILRTNKKIGTISKKQELFLKNINDANNQLINIINDFLNLSRIEQKRLKLDISKFDPSKHIEGIIERFNQEIERKHIKLIYKKSDVPPINVDEPKIIEVITNLVDNAIKYTPEDGEVTIKCEKKNDELMISVKDTGIGIPEKFMDNLFQKFARAENAVHVQPNGNGVGLFLVKKIVEAHQGRIEVHSKEGKGTKFKIYLNYKSDLKPGQEIDAQKLTKKGIIRYREYQSS